MKRVVALLILLFSISYGFASDTALVLKLNAIAVQSMLSNPDAAFSNLEKALVISNQSDYKKGQLLSLKNLGNFYFQKKNYKKSIVNLKKSLQVAEFVQNIPEIAEISLALGKAYNLAGDRENALFYLDKAMKFYTLTNNSAGLHDTFQTLSLVHQSHNEYYQALHFGLEALKISRNFDNKEKVVLSLGNLGQIYTLLNQKQKALAHYLQAISYAEKGSPTAYLPILYIKTGTLYRDNKNLQQSISFLLKAYDLFSKFGNKDGMIAALTETGIAYKNFRQYNKALNFFLRAKTISEQERNFPRIIALNKEISDIHILQKNMHKAMAYLDMNFNIAKEFQDTRMEAEALMNIGNFYIHTKNYNKSIQLLLQSYAIAVQTTDIQLLSDVTYKLSTAYSLSGQHENAYKYLKISKKYTEQSSLSLNNTTFQMLQSVFEVASSEKELELLRKTNEIQRLEKQKALSTQRLLIFGIIALIILIFIFLFIISMYRKTNRMLKIKSLEIEASNQALIEMNVNLEKQKLELNVLNKSLKEANQLLRESEEKYRSISAMKDRLFSVISHDLRSPFSSVVSFVRMMKRDLDKMTKKDISQLTSELEETTDRINILLENLLKWSMVQRGRITFTPERIKLYDITNEVTELFSTFSRNKKIEIKNLIDHKIIVMADRIMLSTIIGNLLSNALKFSYQGSEVVISGEHHNDSYIFFISDTGKGMKSEQLREHIFGNKHLTKPGTDDEQGSGLGLIICNEFLSFHQSELNVKDNEGQGTVLYFSLKKG